MGVGKAFEMTGAAFLACSLRAKAKTRQLAYLTI